MSLPDAAEVDVDVDVSVDEQPPQADVTNVDSPTSAPVEPAEEVESAVPHTEDEVAESPLNEAGHETVEEETAKEADDTVATPSTAQASAEPVEPPPPSHAAPTPPSPPPPPAAAVAESHKKVAFAQPERTSSPPRQRSATRSAPPASSSGINAATPAPPSPAVEAPTHPTNTDASELYARAETERIAAAAAALTPNTVLGLFRRGGDNSHTNRMEAGSYSRYLLSTDHMPSMVLSETFHGEQPTLGTVPRNTVKPRPGARANDGGGEEAEMQQQQQQQHYATAQRGVSTSPSTAPRTHRSSSVSSATGGVPMNSTFTSTTGSGTMKREVDMLEAGTFTGLDETRELRRHDPRKGKPAQPQLDYVYYNHKSKGFYVPHDPSPDTTMLQYNHMYDFGDGTRFAPLASSTAAAGQHPSARGDGAAATFRHNPHAAPPRSFAETRGSVFPLTASQRQHMTNSAPSSTALRSHKMYSTTTGSTTARSDADADAAQQQQQRRRQRAEIQKGTSSLRTATAIDLARLHRTQCPRPRTIEEVLADQQRNYLGETAGNGTTHPLVHDIRRDVSNGKLQWAEVPAPMQTALTAAVQGSAYAAAAKKPSYPRELSAGQANRTASLSQPTNGLVDVMGHLRPVPAIVAATATRSTNATSPTMEAAAVGDGAPHLTPVKERSGGVAARDTGSAASPLPAISRLNYTRQ